MGASPFSPVRLSEYSVPPILAPVSAAIRCISRGSLIFSRKTAGIPAALIWVMIPAISRALGSDSVETPKGAMKSMP